ncbi:MAG TPA: PhnD/SsuA/transferrin family substrate-binding protein [Candidatus Ozemobacteraceae bacterium]|nr:PhnD/SsuA/transferrin family substrate-binding protein [Candidatus Ozemobacteraceae bacterium]
MASLSQRNSIFSGILLLLLAGVLAMVGILWGSFIDFTTPTGIQEVFAGLSSSPAPRLTAGFGNWRELPICYTIPQGDLFRFFELVSPRLQTIASRMAFRAKIDIALDSADVVYRVSTGKAVMGAVSAVAYAKLRRQYPIIAVFERAGRVPKTSLFVVRSDDPVSSLADLRGKRICFRAKDSMSGYYIPLQELKAAGIDPETFFSQISYNDNLANSTLGLISGEFDVILLSNTFYEELPPEQREKLRILYASKPIPGGVYISTASASAQLQTFFAEFQAYGETVAATAPLAGLFQVKPAVPAAYDVLEGASIDDE